MLSVAILGAGPAGMSCALWLKNLGCHPVVLEKASEAGGLLRQNVLLNDWVLGQSGLTGNAMAEHFAKHLADTSVECHFGVALSRIKAHESGFELQFAQNALPALQVQALVVAVGTRVRGEECLDSVPGSASIPDKQLLLGPAAFGSRERFAGKRLLVIGGGDNAHEFVRFTSPYAAHQTMIVRSMRRAQKVQRQAVDQLISEGKVSVLERTRIVETGWHEGQLIARLASDSQPTLELSADMLVLQTGYAPNTDSVLAILEPELRAQLQVDHEGYLQTGPLGRTGREGIYAIGDVSNRDTPCVVTALAAGAAAARDIERTFREAA